MSGFARHPGGPQDPEIRLHGQASALWAGRGPRLLPNVILFLIAVLPYLNTLFNGFVYDDNTQVLNNPYILNFGHLRAILTTTVWSYVGKEGLTNYYRPMMTLDYLVCHELFGSLAYGYHLMNLLLNAGVTLLLFAVTTQVFKRRGLAFLAAAAFALHPIHTESVVWIAGVTDLEVTFFYLLAFWFFLLLPKPGGRRSGWAMLGMTLSFCLALISKEQAMTLPVLATFYEHSCRLDRRQTSWAGKLSRYGVLWLLLVAYLLFRVSVLGGIAPVIQLPNLTWWGALLSAWALVAKYVGKLFWPARLCAFYVFHSSSRATDPRVIAGIIVLGAGLALFLILWSRARAVSFALTWFIVTLAPVLNARWMAGNVFAERYLYLPSVGFCWLLAWAGVQGWDAARQRPFVFRAAWVTAACLIAIVASARIVVRNRDWRDDVTLYTKTLKQSPDAYQILNNLGTVYWHEGRVEDARRCWERALQLRPSKSIFLNNLGLYYSRQKRYAEAESFFRRAMLRKPDYTDAHLNLGTMLRKEGKWRGAELQLKAAIALSPLDYRAHNELAKLDLAAGLRNEAAVEFRRSIAGQPNLTALDALGEMDVADGRAPTARHDFQRALVLDAYDSRARFGLAALDASAGRLQRAIAEYEAGLQSDPANAAALAALEKLKLSSAHDHPPTP